MFLTEALMFYLLTRNHRMEDLTSQGAQNTSDSLQKP